ncbi:hypothetical protein [Sorangium cellulosum]|nr:hypothetical protein [Sorangium cellulosum]
MSTHEPLAEGRLPVEEASTSELLSLSNVFVVEIASARMAPWSRGADGLERRNVEMTVRLLEVLKGSLAQAPGATFPLEIEQRRDGELMVLRHHGLWSHAQPPPDVGVRYLVMAGAAPAAVADAASLMREGACQRLLAPALASDVHLAKQAEKIFQERLSATGVKDPELDAARALLDFANARRAEARDLFGRYLWARILPSFLRSESRPTREALALMTATDATLGLRGECLGSFDRIAPVLANNPDFVRELARALVGMLLDPAAEPLHQRVVTVSLFFLVFPDEATPRVRADAILPDPGERARARQAVAKVPGDRATKLVAWLAG